MQGPCPAYSHLDALRHRAQIVDEIRAGRGEFSRSLFETFNKSSARTYEGWMQAIRPLIAGGLSLDDFACGIAGSLE